METFRWRCFNTYGLLAVVFPFVFSHTLDLNAQRKKASSKLLLLIYKAAGKLLILHLMHFFLLPQDLG